MPWPQVWPYRLLPRRESEPARRAALRSAGWVTGVTGVTGLMASSVLGLPKSCRPVEAGATGGSSAGTFALATVTAIGLTARNRRDARRDVLPIPRDPLPLSSQAAAYEQRQTDKYEKSPSWRGLWPSGWESAPVCRGGFRRIRLRGRHRASGEADVTVDESLRQLARAFREPGMVGAGLIAGLEYVNRQADAGGAAIEAAYSKQPTMLTVSGGPGSQIPFDTLSREGRRIVNMALPAAEITAVTGKPAMDPVRAFAGIATATQVDERVDLLMRELEDMGAFERKVLCFCSPTGTGYLNYVMMETLEYLTGGDCATFALQYSPASVVHLAGSRGNGP